jgi:hypothetical protein
MLLMLLLLFSPASAPSACPEHVLPHPADVQNDILVMSSSS